MAERQHYEYERHGIVHVFLAYNIDTQERFVHIRRRAEEYARFMAALAARCPDAEAIEVVEDNLNIHQPASFYKVFDAQTAFDLSRRFVWHYTPTHASWLNMAEIEFSAFARQCANRRWNGLRDFVSASLQYFHDRNASKTTIEWKFTEYHAREVFKRHYEDVLVPNGFERRGAETAENQQDIKRED